MPDQRERTFDAGFEFARRLKDREFREFVKASGWQSGDHVIMATDDTPVRDIIAKMLLHELHSRALIAIVREEAEFGFQLITVVTVKPRLLSKRRPRGVTPVSLDSTIGMLYLAAHRCPAYLPNEWSRDLLFERVE